MSITLVPLLMVAWIRGHITPAAKHPINRALIALYAPVAQTLIVLLSIPFAVVGSVLLLGLLHYNLSVAVWVGIIALAGVAAETGVVMLIYLDEAYDRWRRDHRLRTRADLRDAVIEGAVLLVRPVVMTVYVGAWTAIRTRATMRKIK